MRVRGSVLPWVLGVAAIVFVGYVSSALSLDSSRRGTARWLLETVPPGREFWIEAREVSPTCDGPWDLVGARYRVQDPADAAAKKTPWCSLGESKTVLPFFVAVQYSWVREPGLGDGGRLWHLCLFGWTLRLAR